MLPPGIVRIWPQYPWLSAGFSTRQGGLSSIYGASEQNLGFTPTDDPTLVAQNRQNFLQALTGQPSPRLVTVRQIHSAMTHVVDDQTPPTTFSGAAPLEGDALLTQTSNLFLGILTADCVPVLVADTRTHAVAAFHAGWRGTLARIVENGIYSMQQNFGSNPADLVAAIGPAIRSCCFAIGPEVRKSFTAAFSYAPELFTEAGPQLHMDLHEANRMQLLSAGVPSTSITTLAECTACTRLPTSTSHRRYFSHRAERGHTGRMLSIIGTTA